MPQTVGWAELDFPLKLNIQAAHLSDEQFLRLCQENPDLRIEMNARGELVIMPPTGIRPGYGTIDLAFIWKDGPDRVRLVLPLIPLPCSPFPMAPSARLTPPG